MLHLQNKTIKEILKIMCILFICTFILSCGFIDLRPIGLSIEPAESNSLLPESFSPVILKFDTEMEKLEAENILQISSDLGMIQGDKYWEGNNLYFVPIAGWVAGVRHTINLSGTIRSIDGREIRLEQFISFYAVNKYDSPILENFYPADGESTGTTNIKPQFHFSRSMNRLSVETALTIEGIANKTFEWSSEDKVLLINFEADLNAWSVYRWNLKNTAKCIDGVPIPITYSGYFTTDLDQELPEIINVYPVMQLFQVNWYRSPAIQPTSRLIACPCLHCRWRLPLQP